MVDKSILAKGMSKDREIVLKNGFKVKEFGVQELFP